MDETARAALAPFDRAAAGDGRGPYQVQQDLQTMMQELVGIVRTDSEMRQALEAIARLSERARTVAVSGNREYNPGWHTALDLGNLLTISEAIARAAIERKESRGGHFREDYPDKDSAASKYNIVVRKGPGGEMQLVREPIAEMPAELKQVVEEQK